MPTTNASPGGTTAVAATPQRVFLTGATGFIGQAIVRALRRRAWPTTALLRQPERPQGRWLALAGVALAAGDVTAPETVRAAMRGADLVIHNAGVYELGADRALAARMRAANVDGTKTTLGLALELGVPRTIYVSTVWALGPTGREPRDERQTHDGVFRSEYERTKVQAHDAALRLRARGLPLVIAMRTR